MRADHAVELHHGMRRLGVCALGLADGTGANLRRLLELHLWVWRPDLDRGGDGHRAHLERLLPDLRRPLAGAGARAEHEERDDEDGSELHTTPLSVGAG